MFGEPHRHGTADVAQSNVPNRSLHGFCLLPIGIAKAAGQATPTRACSNTAGSDRRGLP